MSDINLRQNKALSTLASVAIPEFVAPEFFNFKRPQNGKMDTTVCHQIQRGGRCHPGELSFMPQKMNTFSELVCLRSEHK